MGLKLMFITNSPTIARIAQNAGVDRIFVDLEKLGKDERQAHVNSVKSNHSLEDIRPVKEILTTSELLVRVNPFYRGTQEEVNRAIEAGADILMLPMFKTAQEVGEFIRLVDGRARVNLLLETQEACKNLDDILAVPGIDEVHIGLNDLHLSMRKRFMFELLADGTVEWLCEKLRHSGLFYGFGGVARVSYGDLPAEHIIAEHIRLGSGMVILSRSFCDLATLDNLEVIRDRFDSGVENIRAFEARASGWTPEMFGANQVILKGYLEGILRKLTS